MILRPLRCGGATKEDHLRPLVTTFFFDEDKLEDPARGHWAACCRLITGTFLLVHTHRMMPGPTRTQS
eukprot:COSAG06_NODE_4594_length_4117_cov_53.847934_1_plen_67_part_10